MHLPPTIYLTFLFSPLQDIPSSETDSCSLDISTESHAADDSLYLPTAERMVRESMKNPAIVPSNICFMDLTQLEKFMKQVHEMRVCGTPGCKGNLTPISVKSIRLGGAVSISYVCNGCGSRMAFFETSSKYELGGTN